MNKKIGGEEEANMNVIRKNNLFNNSRIRQFLKPQRRGQIKFPFKGTGQEGFKI